MALKEVVSLEPNDAEVRDRFLVRASSLSAEPVLRELREAPASWPVS